MDVIHQLATCGVHRTYVVDNNGKPVDLITLSNILNCIYTLATGKLHSPKLLEEEHPMENVHNCTLDKHKFHDPE
jgi:hypothetical protein